jgi:hypothetical protein
MILVFGMGAFGSAQFWLSLYMQTVQNLSALEVAVHLLPQVIGGITVNVSVVTLKNPRHERDSNSRLMLP